MLREEVTEVDIADIVSKWSGIPVQPQPSHVSVTGLHDGTHTLHPLAVVSSCARLTGAFAALAASTWNAWVPNTLVF